jgi:hypothetical protein
MPVHQNVDIQQIYDAIKASHGVEFEIVTGGARYKALLQHKDNRCAIVHCGIANGQSLIDL